MKSAVDNQYVKTAIAAAGILGGSYYALKAYKNWRSKREIIIPQKWNHVGELTNIYVYPVKSCGPVIVDKAECSVLGLKNMWLRDRVLMLVDKKNNFLSARAYPEMLMVQTSVQGPVLTLQHRDMEPCYVDLAEVQVRQNLIKATVWGTTVDVLECGFEPSEWFSRLLDRTPDSFRLVYYTSASPRPNRPKVDTSIIKYTADDYGALPDQVSFNMINEASVEDLNTRLKEKNVTDKVTHRNFRPNFVIKGAAAFAEDTWTFVKIGENIFEIIQPCTRCVLTTIDPETGMRNASNEPLKTLRSYRLINDAVVRKQLGGCPRLGVQMALRSPPGIITVGDQVYFA